ncbi:MULTISPECIES: hypothetical protein [Acinetobacter]|jgi:hypothetical protein|uniref:Uncharacterized protein n=1 Tax=Acinetobacter chengduensis TaxID=2420890 RepID=A0ABX9U1U3_9GAMM|nr:MULTISPECIES: hypothetical protein [Acinetobacter]MBI1451518.1 hypothetical protein [Acinetobacter sp. FL51]RKG43063.1 hypothetical protein D7V31_06360 [Acinetobacter sp. WCHAc060007]RLL24557.1 hypothetical protein D9K81_00795 [Acinetobacter chengduensis]
MIDILSSLVTGVVSGIISGLYTAIIGAKYTAFQESKREILKVLRSIHWDEKYIQGHEEKELNRIWLVTRDLLTMKQKEAARLVINQYDILLKDIQEKSDKNIRSLQIISDFQDMVGKLKMNKFELFKFW